ncbi:protein nessun dorma [Microplitis mediator]|uniref:protein nessun dorma n=1 Tax=Microplitis mediator TaxID=375433 RepID=UPI0025534BDB|nr:protein nessun dorma [Microplitis mediator]
MEVYTFDKSLQERTVEFTEILSSRETIVPASRIKSEWSYHVELVIEPVGWQALWKIPRLTCQDFQIHYPTVVVVLAEQVNYSELTVLIKIIAVQDEIHLPEKYEVPLIELYPTKNQDNNALDVVGTAHCIDQLRFFYNYLWMPWDFDDDDNVDWVTLHLETRLRLFFDIKRNNVNKETADIIRTLIKEAKDIFDKISRLEADISDEDEDDEEKEDTKCLVDEGKTCQLMKLHFRMQQIKAEMEVLENPAMRAVLQRNPDTNISNIQIKRRKSRDKKLEAFVVWQGGSLEDTITCLKKIENFLSKDTFIKITGYMQEALDASETNDKIFIGEGEHFIAGAGGLENGGSIKGIGNYENTIICAKENSCSSSLLDFSGEEVLLDNVTVDLGELQVGILVRKGLVKLTGCKIFASNQSVMKLGIVVLPNSKLIVENTVFVNLGTAVVVHAAGDITLKECKFEKCMEGIQLQDEARVRLTDCYLSGFIEYGIRLETQKYLTSAEGKSGSVNLLMNVTEISLEGCTLENNKQGDVLLKPRLITTVASKNENQMEI